MSYRVHQELLRLRAQIAVLQAGNIVLRRTNAKLTALLDGQASASDPPAAQRTKSRNAVAANFALVDSSG